MLEMKDKEFSRNFAAVPQDTTINFNCSAMDVVLMGGNHEEALKAVKQF